MNTDIDTYDCSQSWFWTKEWQEKENKVDEYIANGDVQEYNTIEEFLDSLKDVTWQQPVGGTP